jgi:hypothetical protein
VERSKQIGFNRQIKLEWLDFTASLVLSGQSTAQIKKALDDLLKDQLSIGSNAVRGSRGKAITMLLSIWVTVPNHLIPLRDDALSHLKHLPSNEHLPLHWGMCMTAYPFFGSVAETAGRMLGLQGHVLVSELKKRMQEQHGQRETVVRSTRYVLQCFSGWDILNEISERGVYELVAKQPVARDRLISWLIEATLLASDKAMAPLKSLIRSPMLFPFALQTSGTFSNHLGPDLEYFRQGLDEEMVILTKTSKR